MAGTGSNRGEIESLDALAALFGSVQEASRRKEVTTLPPVYQDMVRASRPRSAVPPTTRNFPHDSRTRCTDGTRRRNLYLGLRAVRALARRRRVAPEIEALRERVELLEQQLESQGEELRQMTEGQQFTELQNQRVNRSSRPSLEPCGNRMRSPDTSPPTLTFSLTRQTVRTALDFPFFQLLLIVLLARSPFPPAHAVSVVAFLFGITVLVSAKSAVAGMRAMEMQQPGSVTRGMRLKSRVNAGVGLLMLLFAAWSETLG